MVKSFTFFAFCVYLLYVNYFSLSMEKEQVNPVKLSMKEWEIVRNNQSTVVFGTANIKNTSESWVDDLWLSIKEKSVLRFQFQRDLNDYILAKNVREGHHFHVPFVDFDKKGNFFLNRDKKQTMIDAKSLDTYQITKKLNTEIEELSERAPELAIILDEIRSKVFDSTESLLEAGRQEDINANPPMRHKHVHFRQEDLVSEADELFFGADLSNTSSLSVKQRHEIIKRKDSMKAMYNMLWPNRMHYFDQIEDAQWPTLSLNNQGKKYICESFLEIVTMYDDNDFLKWYKVFEDNNFTSYVSEIKWLYKRLQDGDGDEFNNYIWSELITKMIDFLFSKHKKSNPEEFMIDWRLDKDGVLIKEQFLDENGVLDEEAWKKGKILDDEAYKEHKRRNSDIRNNKWTFSDFLVSKFYIDNMYSQEYLDEQYQDLLLFLDKYPWFKAIEKDLWVWLVIKTRKKDLLSQILKLLRSADASSMADQLWVEASSYFKDPSKHTPEAEKDLLQTLSAEIANFCAAFAKSQWKEYDSVKFSYKGDLVPEWDFWEHVSDIANYWLDDGVRISSRWGSGKITKTWSNGGYTDLKWVMTYWTIQQIITKDPWMVWIEFQVKPLGHANDRWIQNHYFNRKQRFVEAFARDRSHFSLKQYMESFDDALKKASTNLFRRFKVLQNDDVLRRKNEKLKKLWKKDNELYEVMDLQEKKILTEKWKKDCIYEVEVGGEMIKINLLWLDRIQWSTRIVSWLWEVTDRKLADIIAYSQLKSELKEWRYSLFRYEEDINLEESDSAVVDTSSYDAKKEPEVELLTEKFTIDHKIAFSFPESIRDEKWNIRDIYMVSSNYVSSLNTGHLPASTLVWTYIPSVEWIFWSKTPYQAYSEKPNDIYESWYWIYTLGSYTKLQWKNNSIKQDLSSNLDD